jgi:uncharacterized RDD family membrane protein YckC
MFDSVASLVFFVPGVAAYLVGPREPGTCTDADGFERACEVPTAGTILAGIGLIIVGYLLIVAYHTVPVARSGRTLGRRLFGIRVIDARTLAPPSAGKALGRYLFETWVSAQMCYLGLLWALWDPRSARGTTWCATPAWSGPDWGAPDSEEGVVTDPTGPNHSPAWS